MSGFLVVQQYVENYAPGNYATQDYWQQFGEMKFFIDEKSAQKERLKMHQTTTKKKEPLL